MRVGGRGSDFLVGVDARLAALHGMDRALMHPWPAFFSQRADAAGVAQVLFLERDDAAVMGCPVGAGVHVSGPDFHIRTGTPGGDCGVTSVGGFAFIVKFSSIFSVLLLFTDLFAALRGFPVTRSLNCILYHDYTTGVAVRGATREALIT